MASTPSLGASAPGAVMSNPDGARYACTSMPCVPSNVERTVAIGTSGLTITIQSPGAWACNAGEIQRGLEPCAREAPDRGHGHRFPVLGRL